MKSVLTIEGRRFLINGKLVYSEIPKCPEEYKGLLMNARFIQGVFDDSMDASRFNRFGRQFEPDKNTDDLIASLQEWYDTGLRAVTIGFQGGGSCFTIDSYTINNNPFSPDGSMMDAAYLKRMKKIIGAADDIGMVVIVSIFYGPQSRFLKDDNAVIEAAKTASNWLRDNKFTNVILEVANEHDIEAYKIHPILYNDAGIVRLIEIAQRESGGLPVGCSSTGAYFSESITNASDVVIIHGNNMSRQEFYNQIRKVEKTQPDKPILCNEDSQALSGMQVALDNKVSWGYYNNMTKQEPPTLWGITTGEDNFFAIRLAESLGIKENKLELEEQFYLQGLEENMTFEDKRWVRLATLCPEKIMRVAFYRNDDFVDMAYTDPFTINYAFNWFQMYTLGIKKNEKWKAVITLTSGEVIVKETIVK